MKSYSYNGYAERNNKYINLARGIFAFVMLILTVVGFAIGIPQLVLFVLFYPAINMFFGEKSIKCNIQITMDNNKLSIAFKNVDRGEGEYDEVYEFDKRNISRVYWRKNDKRVGVMGYPVIKYCKNGEAIKTINCREKKNRKRIHVSYPYEDMFIPLSNKNKLVKK